MTKVLVFESDNDFAQSLSTGLSAYGCETKIVEDGEEGISAAASEKPDLILLTIELPRMNGFSVCNKLKRNGGLKKVPLVLLSSEATEETFEQHKRLRTRADEYVHKPVTVEELVAKIHGVVPLEKTGDEQAPESVAELDELEEVEIDEESVEAETDHAFGNLIATDDPAPKADEVEMDDLELEEDDGLEVAGSVAPPLEKPASLPPSAEQLAANQELLKEVSALKSKVSELESDLKAARDAASAESEAKAQVTQKKDAELELAQNEIDELKTKLESSEGAGTAREFLDLREQLNKKDKEILDVRDSLTSKEKELIRVNDETISLGREKADLSDSVAALESEKSDLTKARDALFEDKEQAAKRADDFKARSERLQSDLDERTSELRAEKESHENTVASRDAQEAALRADHQTALNHAAQVAEEERKKAVEAAVAQAQEEAAEAQEAALVTAAEAAKRAQEEAIVSREAELKAEQDSKMAALHRANEESLRKLRAEHDQATEEASQVAADRLSVREQELGDEKEAALAAQKSTSDADIEQLRSEKETGDSKNAETIASLEANLSARTEERETALSTIVERDKKVEELEASVAAQRAEAVELKDKLDAESELLSKARAKWVEDSANVGSAYDAITAAAEELRKAQERPMP